MIYSNKDFTGRNLSQATDLDGQTIINSCFSQEIPDTHVFPDGMKNVTFINCNLDNCFIPSGNIVQGGSQRRFKVQQDGFDWIVDANNNPVERIG